MAIGKVESMFVCEKNLHQLPWCTWVIGKLTQSSYDDKKVESFSRASTLRVLENVLSEKTVRSHHWCSCCKSNVCLKAKIFYNL